jgi:hypothetical protein
MAKDPFDLLLPVPRPERPKNQIRTVRQWELRETVDPTMFADPIPCLHMIGMSIFGESGCFGLLRSEEPLLLLSEIEEPQRRFSVRLSHDTILQIFWGKRSASLPTLTIQSRKKLPESSTFGAKLAKIA